jgi:hypothetical protein
MTTRKQLIITKYVMLETELKKYIKDDLFPSLDIIDVADLVYLITMMFVGIDTPSAYDLKIKELISINKFVVTDEVYLIVLPLVMDFIIWLKAI